MNDSAGLMMAALVGGSALVIVAILIWAPRYRPCPACGARMRVDAHRCPCGRDLGTRLPDETRAKLATVVGEANLAAVEQWVSDAAVREPLGWVAWLALETAYKAMLANRMDIVADLINKIDELSKPSRERLLQSAEGSIVIREELKKYR